MSLWIEETKIHKLYYTAYSLYICLMTLSCYNGLDILYLSVFVGRNLMSLWMGETKIHELYTAACGLYVCWMTLRIGTVLYNWIPQGTGVILNKVKEWTLLVRNSIFISIPLNKHIIYSDDSLIRAPIIRKSRLSGQKVREPISATLICSDKPEIHVPDPEINFGDRFPEICKIKLINPDKIFTCKQNLQFAEKCTFCMTCLY